MRIAFERTGGFAAIPLAASFDPDQMGAAGRDLRHLVDGAGFFDLPGQVGTVAPDGFTTRITIEDGAKRHTVEVKGQAGPAGLQALVGWLRTQARR